MSSVTERKRKAAGVCPGCGVEHPKPGRVWGPDCLRARERKRQLRQADLAKAGLCPDCGRMPRNPGRRVCAVCLKGNREAVARYRRKKRKLINV